MYRVYEYGVVRVTAGEDVAIAQLLARGRYWNSLVEVEQQHLAQVEEVLRQRYPHLDALEDDQYRAARREAFADPSVKEGLQPLNAARTAAVRAARQRHAAEGLYWGNYLDVERNYRTARQRAARRLAFKRPVPEGVVSVWFQDGLPAEQVWGEDSRFSMDLVPREAWDSPVRGVRRRLAHTHGRLRVGSEGPRHPLYVEFDMVMHRPIPSAGIVRHVSLVRRRAGPDVKYALMVTVDESALPLPHAATGLVLGVDLGWRLIGETVRVGYVATADGRVRRDLVLPGRVTGGFTQLRNLASIRDNLFNGARARLREVLKTLVAPDWLARETATLAHWRSQRRLAVLLSLWRGQRFDGDAEVFADLGAWHTRDLHLWRWEANLRDQLLRHRREVYRQWAKEVAGMASMVALEDFDLRGVTGAADELPAAARMRHEAAVHTLRDCIEAACAARGVQALRVAPQYTTQRCHQCADLMQFDARKEVSVQCPHCGSQWDQDDNAARNLASMSGGGLRAVLA